ncbi:MAG: DUF3667 domain-containing protein [Prevotella sp.]|nr:DUF3667 domain-containing protein [Prevotella sp.]
MEKTWTEKYREFRAWQQRPYVVAPMSQEEHDCPTCGTHYQGNYCPRCGQSAKIGRYSFKKAFLLFLDVWGLGNRGMFRTLRDLLLRPGYMIRDYLSGMQMAYFPPFKMLFLLTTLGILVAHGLNISGTSQMERQREAALSMQGTSYEAVSDNAAQGQDIGVIWVNKVFEIQERFPNLLSLGSIVFMSIFLYIFFRKSKNFDHLRYSEFFIAMVYTANMLSIYETVLTFFCIPSRWLIGTALLSVIPMKQFSGFSWIRTISYMLIAIVLMLILIFVLVAVSVIVGLTFFPQYFPNVQP